MNMKFSDDRRQTSASPSTAMGAFRKTRLGFVDHGDMLRFSGKEFKILKIDNPISILRDSRKLGPEQKAAYLKVIEALLPVRELSNRIASKQLSEGSVELIDWLGKVIDALPKNSKTEKLLEQLHTYHLFVSNNLSPFEMDENIKFVPGFSKDELKEAIVSIGHEKTRVELLTPFDVRAEQIFSVQEWGPNANLFRFRNAEDEKIFIEGLGDNYKALQSQLEAAVRDFKETPGVGVGRIARISQKINKMKADAMREQVETAKGEHDADLNTVVFMHYEGGVMKTEAVTYEKIFRPELEQMSECFKRASEEAQSVSLKLSEQLALLSEAVLTGDFSKADQASYRMTAEDSYVDVALEYKETYAESVLGCKGVYSFRISLADEEEHESINSIRADERFRTLNIERKQAFIVGGFQQYFRLSGQKLPNEPGQDLYRDVVFTNVSMMIQQERLKLAEDVLQLKSGDMDLIMDAATVAVDLHEAGHVFGTSISPHLKPFNNATEECQAEGSVAQLGEEKTPGKIRGLMLRAAAYGPIWMMVGLKGAHKKADLYIVGRLMEEGAITINDNNKLVVDVEKAVPIVKEIARECRLLERPADGLKDAARKKAEDRFGDERINAIAGKLRPVADRIMGKPVPFAVFPYQGNPLQHS